MTRRVAPACAVFAVIALLAWVATPWVNALADPIAGVDAARDARLQDRDADRARGQAAARDVDRLKAQLTALAAAQDSGVRTMGGAQQELRRLNLAEAELRAHMARNQETLTRLLGALETYQRHPPPPLLVDARSARDAVTAAILMKAITPELEARSRVFAAQSDTLKRIRRRAAETSGALFQAESDVADRQARIEDLIAQKRALEQRLYSDASLADDDARRLADRARSLGELVARLRARGVAEGAGPRQAFRVPVEGPLVRRFGQSSQGSPAGGERLHARGWTWASGPGAEVVSPAAGRIDYAGALKDWGLVLILRVGADDVVMAGLAELDVDTGRDVTAGEPVGRMPAAPAGDPPARPQLYLEVRRGARPVDPAPWFAASGSRQDARAAG